MKNKPDFSIYSCAGKWREVYEPHHVKSDL